MDITDLLPKKTSVPTPQTMPNRGVISTPPVALTDLTMRVIVPGHSSDYDVECRWVRQGDALPAAGADCLVVWDETGAGTIVAWEGAGVSLLAIAAALDARLDTLEATRTVRGAVSAAGAVVRGNGFSVSAHPSTGLYTITYSVAFPTTPILSTGLGATASIASVALTAESASAFSVAVVNQSAALANGAFSFHATSVEGG